MLLFMKQTVVFKQGYDLKCKYTSPELQSALHVMITRDKFHIEQHMFRDQLLIIKTLKNEH